MVTSACPCVERGRLRVWEKLELVCVGGLWRMGGESLLMPVWRSVRVGFIDKEGWMLGCSKQEEENGLG